MKPQFNPRRRAKPLWMLYGLGGHSGSLQQVQDIGNAPLPPGINRGFQSSCHAWRITAAPAKVNPSIGQREGVGQNCSRALPFILKRRNPECFWVEILKTTCVEPYCPKTWKYFTVLVFP